MIDIYFFTKQSHFYIETKISTKKDEFNTKPFYIILLSEIIYKNKI